MTPVAVVLYGFALLLVFSAMFEWAREQADCNYCGGVLGRHEEDCPRGRI